MPVFCLIKLPCSDVAVFPDLSNYFGEYSVIVNTKYDGWNTENKTYIVVNWNYPLIILTGDWKQCILLLSDLHIPDLTFDKIQFITLNSFYFFNLYKALWNASVFEKCNRNKVVLPCLGHTGHRVFQMSRVYFRWLKLLIMQLQQMQTMKNIANLPIRKKMRSLMASPNNRNQSVKGKCFSKIKSLPQFNGLSQMWLQTWDYKQEITIKITKNSPSGKGRDVSLKTSPINR